MHINNKKFGKMKKIYISLFIILEIIVLIKINSEDPIYLKIKKLEDSFPDVNTQDTFYFKKISSNNFIIGTQNSAKLFRLSNLNSNENIITLEQHESLQNNYYAYADDFGNINPIFGLDNIDNPTKIKYILTEGVTPESEYTHALYDIENNILKEGRLSDEFPDFKILEALNENEYIGAVKLYDSNTNINSIKLQIMSFNEISQGKIKILNQKNTIE